MRVGVGGERNYISISCGCQLVNHQMSGMDIHHRPHKRSFDLINAAHAASTSQVQCLADD